LNLFLFGGNRMSESETRGKAAALLDAFAVGDEFERALAAGEITGVPIDEATRERLPEGVGQIWWSYADNAAYWYAAPIIVAAWKKAAL
jgi:hypothetical protein